MRTERQDDGPRRVDRKVWLALVVAAIPFAAALAGLSRHHWFLTGDWASIDLRVREVGTRDTPLVGPYSTHGWAHPGPLLYWLAAPLHRLSGGIAQSLSWTAAIVNLVALAVIARVGARRVGTGFAVAALVFASIAAHGIGPGRIVDIWNPLLPLFPLLAVCVLAWSGATGDRRHAAGALVLAAAVGQAHVGMIPVVGLVGVWAVGWWLVVQRPAERAEAGTETDSSGAAPRRERWRWPLASALAAAVVLWLPPVLDQVWGQANLTTLYEYFTGGTGQSVGLRRGVGLVSRYVRPDGPWLGGAEPNVFGSVIGSGALPVLALALALAVLAVLAWRRGDRLVAAGTSQALFLVLGAGAIAAKIEEPVWDYLVKWLIMVACWAWLWVAWGAWCLVRGHLPSGVRAKALPVALVGLFLVACWSVPAALRLPFPAGGSAPAVEAIRPRLERRLDKDRIIRIEHRGDDLGEIASGVIYWLWRDGYRVVSSDGSIGDKYGPDVAWHEGDPDGGAVYTVAVHFPGRFRDVLRECSKHPGARLVASYHQLGAADRQWLEDFQVRNLFDPGSISSADVARSDRLSERDLSVEVWKARDVCASGA
ncbi:hypothetical protein BH10ACT1_BH10ACT1_19800 [soil metagenome]